MPLLVTQWITGISIEQQQDTRDEGSIKREKARDDFLGFVFEARRGATYDDYRKFLVNTPELSRFNQRYVLTVTPSRGGVVRAPRSGVARPR